MFRTRVSTRPRGGGCAQGGREAGERRRGLDLEVREDLALRLGEPRTLADGKRKISPPHLTAALALHDYAARSAAWALAGATGQPLAEQIHAALRSNPAGLTRSQISDTLKHNQPAGQLDHALRSLEAAGRATVTQIATGGRPAQLWTTTPAT